MCKSIDVAICNKDSTLAHNLLNSQFAGTKFEPKFDEAGNHISGFFFKDNRIDVKSVSPPQKIEDILIYKPTGEQIYRYETNDLTLFYEPGLGFLSIFDRDNNFDDFLKKYHEEKKLYTKAADFFKTYSKGRKFKWDIYLLAGV